MTAERYIPADNKFIKQFPNNIIRVYHSWSLLLPDATVINGGGGLCATAQPTIITLRSSNLHIYSTRTED